MKNLLVSFLLFIIGALIATSYAAKIPTTHRNDTNINVQPSKIAQNAYKEALANSAPIPTFVDKFRRDEAIFMERSPVFNRDGIEYHTDMMYRYFRDAYSAFARLNFKILEGYSDKLTIVNEVSKEAIIDIRNYAELLEITKNRLLRCSGDDVHDYSDFKRDGDYHFEKTYDLFLPRNVYLYQKIQEYLAFGKNKTATMMFIDVILEIIFKMSNLCVTKYQFVLKDDMFIKNIDKEIDISCGNMGEILARGRPGKYKTIREIMGEM